MKYFFICLLSFFVFTGSAFADRTENCTNYGFYGTAYDFNSALGSFVQDNTAYTDCYSYESDPRSPAFPSIDRDDILISFSSNEPWKLNVYSSASSSHLFTKNYAPTASSSKVWKITVDELNLSDGEYVLQVYYQALAAYFNTPIPFYLVNQKVYFDINDIPVEETDTTDTSVGSLNVGLAIIIVLLSLFTLTFIYSSMTNKKPWQK